jgi:hypothetical protein
MTPELIKDRKKIYIIQKYFSANHYSVKYASLYLVLKELLWSETNTR